MSDESRDERFRSSLALQLTLNQQTWSRVSGTTQPAALSPEILDQWVKWMITAGLQEDCDFDGWGVQL